MDSIIRRPPVLVIPGAYEPPKAAKEHTTYIACRVPSQSKFITKYFPYKENKILLFVDCVYQISNVMT